MFYDGFLQLDLVLYLRIVLSQHGPVLLQKPQSVPMDWLFWKACVFLWWSYTDPKREFPGNSNQPAIEVFNGVKSSGKVVYFTATFPYICLAIFLVSGPGGQFGGGLFRDGSGGVRHFKHTVSIESIRGG